MQVIATHCAHNEIMTDTYRVGAVMLLLVSILVLLVSVLNRTPPQTTEGRIRLEQELQYMYANSHQQYS